MLAVKLDAMTGERSTVWPSAGPPSPTPPRADKRHPAMRLLPTLLSLSAACAACGALALVGGTVVGAAAFVTLVLGLAVLRPSLVFVLALVLAPFPNDIQIGLPVKVAASDLCLFVALPLVIARRSRHFVRAMRTPYWLPVISYLGLCVASTVLTGLDREAIVSTSQMFVYMVFTVMMFAAGFGSAVEIVPRLYTVSLIGTVLAVALIIGGTNYVFGLHKNSAGSTLAAAVLVTLGLLFSEAARGGNRKFTVAMLALLATGLLASLSRGAWLGAVAGALVILVLYGRILLAVRLGIACLPLMVLLWLVLPEGQKEYATDLSMDAHNVKARLLMIDYALARFRESPMIGVGVGLRKTYDATNLALSTLAESGVLGLVSFLAIYATLAFMVISAARRLERRDSAFALLAVGASLVLAKFLHGMVDHYWSRGAIVFWAGAGFVIIGYLRSRQPANRTGVVGRSVGEVASG